MVLLGCAALPPGIVMRKSKIRLLVFDEEFPSGSVQTLCLNLLPELARFCEVLVWAVPNFLCQEFANRVQDAPSLLLEGHNWPRWSVRSLPQRVLRKIDPPLCGKLGRAAAQSLRDTRIRALAKKYRCTHFLTSCIFSQRSPDVALPIFGFVCDINPAMPGEARLNIARWVAEAQGIFCISEFTRQELQRIKPSQAAKIHAIPLAAPEIKNFNPKPSAARQFDFYYPAAAMPHKNHLVLFQACVALAQLGWNFHLALTGSGMNGFRVNGVFSSPGMDATREFLFDHAPLLGRSVEVFGEVGLSAVEAFYEDTRCVVLPSAYEGFGFPLAEAIRRGIPVISSDIPAFREQLATLGEPDNVHIVPPNDSAALAAAMERFLKSAPDRPKDRKPSAGAPFWTWEDAAQRCFELLSTGVASTS
jgi:glycosyltransferase involved in cell wall biosynthesis